MHVIHKIEEESAPPPAWEQHRDEDVIVAAVDARRGVRKQPSEEERAAAERDRHDAYEELARQLQDQAAADAPAAPAELDLTPG